MPGPARLPAEAATTLGWRPLPRPPEHPVALLHELPVRPQRRVARQQEARVLESLQAVLQDRPVRLVENVLAQLHRQVRPHAQDVPVERRVVQLAQRQPVRHDRLAPRMPVRQDVRRVEQLLVPQPADGALLAVGPQHPLPELLLVHALLAEARPMIQRDFPSVSWRSSLILEHWVATAALISAPRSSFRPYFGVCMLMTREGIRNSTSALFAFPSSPGLKTPNVVPPKYLTNEKQGISVRPSPT